MTSGIMITGPSGSGKTTLGKRVAGKLGYPYFDVDDYIWRDDTEKPYTIMYTKDEKIERLQNALLPFNHFVMAGSMSSFHDAFDDMFKLMAFLYAPPDIRVQRVHIRALERFGSRVAEGGDLYENHILFLKKNLRYETDGSPNLFDHRKWISSLSCPVIELDGTDTVERNADRIVEKWDTIAAK